MSFISSTNDSASTPLKRAPSHTTSTPKKVIISANPPAALSSPHEPWPPRTPSRVSALTVPATAPAAGPARRLPKQSMLSNIFSPWFGAGSKRKEPVASPTLAPILTPASMQEESTAGSPLLRVAITERYNPAISPTDSDFISIKAYFAAALARPDASLGHLLETAFDQHERAMLLPAARDTCAAELQLKETERFCALLEGRFRDATPDLALKLTFLYFGLPVQPMAMDEIPEDMRTSLRMQVQIQNGSDMLEPPLYFLKQWNSRKKADQSDNHGMAVSLSLVSSIQPHGSNVSPASEEASFSHSPTATRNWYMHGAVQTGTEPPKRDETARSGPSPQKSNVHDRSHPMTEGASKIQFDQGLELRIANDAVV